MAGFVRRVGWIRVGALGDLLVGLASLRETLDRWPESAVTVVGPKLWLEILQPGFWPQIDRVAVGEKRSSTVEIFERVEGEWRRRDGAPVSLKKEFASEYDVVFNTRVDSARQGFPAFFAGVPERWGAAAGLGGFIYNKRARHNGKDPLIHERDVALLLMDEAEFGAAACGDLRARIQTSARIARWKACGLPCPRDLDRRWLQTKLGWQESQNYCVINPTSSRREKAWPSTKYRALLGEIAKMAPTLQLAVVGSPAETGWLQEVAIGVANATIVQPSSIGELFNVIAGGKFVVANTSSVQFIAACTETAVLTLVGRAKLEIWGPVGPRDRTVIGREPADVESMFERERLAYESIELGAVVETLHQSFLGA